MRTSKILLVLLTIALLAGTIAPVLANNGDAYAYESAPVDPVGPPPPSPLVNRAIDVLRMLGLANDFTAGDFAPELDITRAEFAAIIIDFAFGIEPPAIFAGEGQIFGDVAVDAWYARYVALANRMGWLVGDHLGAFRPNNLVTFEQAVTTLVRVLGYGSNARGRGGFPMGYLVVATELGLLDGLRMEGTNALNRGEMALLMYNALNIEMQVRVMFGNQFMYERRGTFLAEQHNIFTRQGVVQGAHFTSMFAGLNLNADEAVIDGVTFYIGNTNPRAYLGMHVEAYYRMDRNTGDRTLVNIIGATNRNRITKVYADEIINYSDRRLEYDPGMGMSRTVNIPSTAILIFNGMLVESYNQSLIRDMDMGHITLIDNTGNGQIDVAVIISQVNYVVDMVHPTYLFITDKFGLPRLYVNTERNPDLRFTMTDMAGAVLRPDHANEWSVITTEISLCGNVINMVLSNRTIEGSIDEISTIGRWTYVTIGGNSFRLVGGAAARNFNVGDVGMFFLDIHGHIAAADTARNDPMTWGYIIDIELHPGLQPRAYARVFTENGAMLTIPFARHVTVGDQFINNFANHRQQYIDALHREIRSGGTNFPVDNLWNNGGWPNGMDFYPQMIRFETNATGEILEVDTFYDDPSARIYRGGEENFDLRRIFDQSFVPQFQLPYVRANGMIAPGVLFMNDGVWQQNGGPNSPNWQAASQTFGGIVGAGPNTRVFWIPSRPREAEPEFFRTQLGMGGIWGGAIRIEAFRATPGTNRADVVVMYETRTFIPYNTEVAVFDRMTEFIDEDGVRGMQIHTHSGGHPATLRLANMGVFEQVMAMRATNYHWAPGGVGMGIPTVCTNPTCFGLPLNQGDLVRFRLNPSGDIDMIERVFDRAGDTVVVCCLALSPAPMLPLHFVASNMTGGWQHDADNPATHITFAQFSITRGEVQNNITGSAAVTHVGRVGGNEGAMHTNLHNLATLPIFIYDPNLPEAMRIRRGGLIDVMDAQRHGRGSDIVITTNRGNPRLAIIYLPLN